MTPKFATILHSAIVVLSLIAGSSLVSGPGVSPLWAQALSLVVAVLGALAHGQHQTTQANIKAFSQACDMVTSRKIPDLETPTDPTKPSLVTATPSAPVIPVGK
jgi:hypothetical protein